MTSLIFLLLASELVEGNGYETRQTSNVLDVLEDAEEIEEQFAVTVTNVS